jgi:hypothetical protein
MDLYVAPHGPSYNGSNDRIAGLVYFRYVLIAHSLFIPQIEDDRNVFLGKRRRHKFTATRYAIWHSLRPVPVSGYPGLPAFSDLVSYVIGISSKKEVLRITARRVIAFMTDKHPGWNIPIL